MDNHVTLGPKFFFLYQGQCQGLVVYRGLSVVTVEKSSKALTGKMGLKGDSDRHTLHTMRLTATERRLCRRRASVVLTQIHDDLLSLQLGWASCWSRLRTSLVLCTSSYAPKPSTYSLHTMQHSFFSFPLISLIL